jgi:hypothetical protein
LKFDLPRGQPPLKSLAEKMGQTPWETKPAWIFFAGDALYIGQPDTLGIWSIPASEVETAVVAQKQLLLAGEERARKAAGQFQKDFLAKYDRNHNGVLDPEEKQKAMDDPGYTKFMANVMQADRARANGRLSPTNAP